MIDGFLRVAAATPRSGRRIAPYNAEQILGCVAAAPEDTALLVFPELCLTGYTCGDLFLSSTLLAAAEKAMRRILSATVGRDTVLLIGLPVPVDARLFNCAAVCQRGILLGLVPKTHLPAYSEFYEARHFSPAGEQPLPVTFAGQQTRLSSRQLFECRSMPSFRLGVEICEDLWVASPPSAGLAAGRRDLDRQPVRQRREHRQGRPIAGSWRRPNRRGFVALMCMPTRGRGNRPPIWCSPGTIWWRKTASSWRKAPPFRRAGGHGGGPLPPGLRPAADEHLCGL